MLLPGSQALAYALNTVVENGPFQHYPHYYDVVRLRLSLLVVIAGPNNAENEMLEEELDVVWSPDGGRRKPELTNHLSQYKRWPVGLRMALPRSSVAAFVIATTESKH